MAFTKINAAGIGSTELVTLHSLEVLNNATVGGVLTYEDVTNVDSIGLITARNGIVVGSGITLSKDGDIFATGISTISVINSDKIKLGDNEFIHIGVGSDLKLSHDSNNSIITNSTGELLINSSIINLRDTSNNSRLRVEPAGNINIVKNLNVTGITTVSGNVKVGSGITLSPDGHSFVAGVSTIGTLSVSGIATVGGVIDSTAGTVTSSGNMTVGGKLIISGNSAVKDIEYGDGSTTGYFRSITNVDRSNAEASIHMQQFKWNNTKVAEIKVLTGDDTTNKDNAHITFETASAGTTEERLRITSTGKIGINIDDPDAKLEVRDSAAAGIIIRSTQTQATDTNKAIRVRNNSDTDTFAVSHKGKVFPLDNIVMASGKGIDFGATGDAGGMSSEVLDDYEEGTWSPAFKAANNSSSANTEVLDARYTKIGRKVYVCAFIKLTAHATGTTGGLAHITGLPFNNMSEYSAISVGYWANFAANQMFVTGTAQPTSNYIVLRHTTSAAANTTNMDYDNNLQPNSGLIFSLTYHTSA